MHLRTLATASLVLCLGLLPACDDKKGDAKPADTKGKTEEKKVDAKVDEKKADEVKADEAKADEKKADEAKADEAKADEAKADEAKADEAKADEAKADEAKADEKKADDPKKPKEPKEPKPDEGKTDPKPAGGADGKDLFGKKCKSCHGASGDAKTKIGEENDIEDWTKAGWKAKWPESKIVDIVTNGKAGTKMKPFKEKLTADEIAAVAKYARSLGK